MTDFAALLRCLSEAGVEYVLVGGAAATAHGSARLTQDVDVVYRRSPENLRRLASALGPHAPYLRGAPPGLPFRWDAATLLRGLNFTLTTDLGAIDLLGEITGGGRYEDLVADCVTLKVFGILPDPGDLLDPDMLQFRQAEDPRKVSGSDPRSHAPGRTPVPDRLDATGRPAPSEPLEYPPVPFVQLALAAGRRVVDQPPRP